MSKLLAPNGKPSKLTPEQYKLVRLPEFKAWFGDWENSPETSSKVVDENGEPLVVWRGESNDFNIFQHKKLGSTLKTAWRNAGFYFSPTKLGAEQYMYFYQRGILKQFFLNIKNPYTLDSKEFFGVMDWGSLPTQRFKTNKSATDFALKRISEIKSENYNGAFVTILEDDNIVEIIAFESNQIKLADGSNTTFDGNNPDIRFKNGGDTKNKIMEKQMEIKFDKNYAEGGVTYSEWLKDDYWQEQFDAWMQDGNVSKKADGTYSTQDAQYRNSLKGMSELKKYFYNEFIKGQNSGYFADGGGIENYENFINIDKMKPEKYKIVTNFNTLKSLAKNGFIELHEKTGLRYKNYESKDRFRENRVTNVRHDYIKSATSTSFEYNNKKYTIGYIKGLNFLELYVLEDLSNNSNNYADGGSADDKHLIAKAIEYITGYSVDTNTIQKEANNYSFKYKSRNVFSTLNAKLIDDTIRMHRKSLENRYEKGGEAGKDIYDFDKKMALINLGQVYEYAIKIDKMIKENTDLEEWVKMKLTRIEQNIADVKHSLEGWEKYKSGGEIAKKQLLHIAKYSKDLIEMIEGGSKLMSWQENKLAVSSDSIDNIYHHLDYKMGNRAEDLDVNNEYARGGRPRTKSKEKVLNVRSRGGFTLDDFNPKLNLYDKIVSYKKVGELELNQISEKKYVEDTFEFKTEKDRDYWYDILTEEQENYFTIKNKKKYVNYILEWHDPYSEKAEEEGITKKSEMLDYFYEEIDYELRLNTSREDFIKTLDLQTKFEDGGYSEGYADGGVVEYETKRIVNEAKNQKKNTHFAIHKPTNSIVFTWDFSGYDTKEMNENKEHYFYYDVKDIVSGNVDKYVKSDYAIVQRKDLEKRGIDLNNYLVFMGQKYNRSESNSNTDSGEAGFNDEGTSMVLYHEKNGNFLVPKGQVYLYLYDVEDSRGKLQSSEYDWVFYPYASQNMAWASDFIPPLKKIWTKKFQKEHKGSEHLLGVIKAYLIDKENGEKELFIDMMSVNPTKMKKGIMSYMIKELRDTFKLEQDQVTFSQLTDEGKKFVEKKTYADGGWVLVDADTERKLGEYETESEARKMMYEYEGNSNILEKSFFDKLPPNPNKHSPAYNFADGGKVLASSSSKDGINKLIEQYLYGSTITLVQTDNDKIYEVHNKKGKTSFYVEFSRGKYKFIQPSMFADGGVIDSFVNDMVKNQIARRTLKIKNQENFIKFMNDIQPYIDKKIVRVKVNPINKEEVWVSLQEFNQFADGGTFKGNSNRNETQKNNFGVSYKLGDKFTLGRKFGNKDEEVSITEIMPSGLFFKVDKSSKIFSIKTLHSKGSTYTSGEYLVPIKKEYADGGDVEEIKTKYQIAGSDKNGVYTYSKRVADEIAKMYGGNVEEDGSKWYVRFEEKFANGGDIPHEDKMFQLPLEMVVYVPSTQDVDKVISVDEMVKRVNEVKEYLGSKFGGYSSTDKLGGFVDSKGNLINEDVTQVTSFATKEAFEENKEELIQQLAKWGKKWGQEAIGFEFEGDLLYVPQELKSDTKVDEYRRGGFMYEVQKKGSPSNDMRETMFTAKNLTDLKKKIIEKHGTSEGFIVSRRTQQGYYVPVKFENGGEIKRDYLEIRTYLKNKDLILWGLTNENIHNWYSKYTDMDKIKNAIIDNKEYRKSLILYKDYLQDLILQEKEEGMPLKKRLLRMKGFNIQIKNIEKILNETK